MVLNWTIEVASTFITGTILLFTAMYTFRSKQFNKLRAVFFLRLTWNFLALFFYLEGLSYLFLEKSINILHALTFVFPCLFLILCINYIKKETIYSKGLLIAFGVIVLYCYLVFQPGSIVIVLENNILTISWRGAFEIVAVILLLILPIYTIYWGYLTWKNSPFLIKRESAIFFLGTCIASIGSAIFYLLNVFIPILIHFSNLSLGLGAFIVTVILVYQPQLIYVLPFTLYRISVKDRDGFMLFDHHWSESDVSEIMFMGFINAIQIMSEEVLHKGGLLDINLREGVLLMHESKYITVGLISSKSSKLVRDALKGFTVEFESMFQKPLISNEKDMSKYKSAYTLIQKYFSNFPSRIITSNRQSLLLKNRVVILKQLKNELKTIITDENEYEKIIIELAKSPFLASEDFLKLYKELEEKDKALKNESDSEVKKFLNK